MLVLITNNDGRNTSEVYDLSHKEDVEKHYTALVRDQKIKEYKIVIPN